MTKGMLAFTFLVGCGRIAFDPNVPGSGDGGDGGGSSDSGTDGSAACATVPNCPGSFALMVNNGTDLTLNVTADADRGFSGSCGGNPGAEAIWQILGQQTGHYTFSTIGGPPLTLYVRGMCCSGPELGCTTNASTNPVTISLGLGENAIVFVDGANTGQMLMLHTMGAP